MARVVRHFYRQARFSRGTAAEWTAQDPTLFEGEPGFETDTRKLKIGNGTDPWSSLLYFGGGAGVDDHGALTGLGDDDHAQYLTAAEANALYEAIGAVTAHEGAGDPHPGYLTPAEANALYEALGAVATHAALTATHGVGEVAGIADITFEQLDTVGDVGTAANTLAEGDHTHPGAGHVIADAGTPEDQRGTLDFQDGFIVTDNAGGDATEVDLDFGAGATQAAPGDHTHAGAGHVIAEDDTPVTQRGTLNFGAGLDVADDAGNDASDVVVDLSEVTAFTDHNARHEDGGADEMDLTGLSGTPAALATHAGAADPHTGYRLESADHTHQSTGAEAGQLDHGSALTGLTDDDHTQYLLESTVDAKGDILAASADNVPARLAVGTAGQRLTPKTDETTGLVWADDTFTVGGVLLDPTGARTVEVWRAPFACEVTAYHARVVGGTNAVTNAQVDSTDLLTGDLTTEPGDGWEAGTVKSDGTEDITAGEVIKLEVVSVSGAVTSVSWTITLRRAA